MRAKIYEPTEITWDYDLGEEDAILTLEVEFYAREGLSPDPALFDPGEPAEFELTGLTVTGALVGPDLREASLDECKAIQRQLRRNPVEMSLIEDYVARVVS